MLKLKSKETKVKKKKQKAEKGSTTIVTIDRVNEQTFGFAGNEVFHYERIKKGAKNEFYITYLPYKDILTTTVEVSRSTPDDEIIDAITIKTYEDLSLNPDDDFKITYLESDMSDNDNRIYNVFVVNNSILRSDLSYIADNTKYIDYVAKAPFLMYSLYKRNILPSNTVDCFIYFQEEDAFLVIYQNGKYLDSRSIRYNLKFIWDKFVELSGDRVDVKDFYSMLSKDGLISENAIDGDNLIQIFDEMFLYISDILTSITKVNKISLDNVFFGTDIGNIKGSEEFITERLGVEPKPFDFNIAINQKDFEDLTQLDVLMMLTAKEYLINKDDEYNYSTFLRPPPLAQRPVGKLIGVGVAALIAILAYPAYQYAHGFYNQKLTEKKEIEYAQKDKEKKRIESALANLQDQINKKREEITAEQKILKERSDLLTAMYNKKVEYPMKSKAIFDMTNMINKQSGELVAIHNIDENLTFEVRTETEKKMTELLKAISNTKGYNVDTKLILLDENNQTIAYESNVSVEMKK